jgi:hypothetical protein
VLEGAQIDAQNDTVARLQGATDPLPSVTSGASSPSGRAVYRREVAVAADLGGRTGEWVRRNRRSRSHLARDERSAVRAYRITAMAT